MARASQNYYPDGEYLNKKNRVFSLNQEMLDKINNIPDVIDNLTSTSSTDALSANMGRELSKQIQSLESGARWLSTWDSRFGIPNTFPGTLPYQYKAGDNYLVSQVSDTANYRPDGSQFIGDRSFVVETSEVHPGDSYIYDGTNWILQVNSPIEVNEYTAGDGIKIDENNEISVKASAIAGTGLTTDTNNNLIVDSSLIAWKSDIPTNVSQLINDRGYITENDLNIKTFYLQDRSDIVTAQEAYDWFIAGKNPILVLDENTYFIKGTSNGGEYVLFKNGEIGDYSDGNSASTVRHQVGLAIHQVSGHVDFISSNDSGTGGSDYRVLLTGVNYQDPYNPEYDGSPATKKYVDDSINTKTFYIADATDLTNAQAALDWYKAGNNPIVSYNDEMYYFKEYQDDYYKKLWFYKNNLTVLEVGNRTMIYRSMLGFDLDSEGTTVTGIRDYNFDTIAEVLDTSTEYSSPFIPQYDGSPTSKKYVDDNDVQKGSTAPGNPTQGMLWYDTTNDVLKSYDGNNWNEVGSDATDINTKTFYLANNQDTTTGQAILDWVLAGKNAIVWHMGKQIYFKYISKTSSRVTFHSEWYEKAGSSMPAPGRYLAYYIMYLDYSGSTLSSIADYYGDNAVGYLSTVAQNYRYTPSNEYDPATKKYVDDKFSAGNYIDIKNGVISAVGLQENLTAGDNITFYEYCHANTQGPCPDGFHIPTNDEATALLNTGITLGAWTGTDGTSLNNFETYLKAPGTGYYASMLRLQRSGCVERWTSSTFRQWNFGYKFSHTSASAGTELQQTACGTIIRPFKNEGVAPDSSWTTIYDGSSVAQGAGIFHNATEGIISISADGTTRITIADKNLGATQVWNYGDAFTADNIGKMYQWGNNYGFEFSATQPKTSADKVDASGYGPNRYLGGNYYYDDTFIQNSDGWDSSANKNLWGGNDLTGVWCDHMISAEGKTYTAGNGINIDQNDEISVDNTIARSSDVNTKTFYLANNSDLVTAQAAYDWWAAGKNPIVIRKYAGIESVPFSVYRLMDNTLEFTALYSGVNDVSYNTKRQRRMEFRVLNGTVNDIIFVNLDYINYIDPTATYSTPFIPTQDGQPATKKYVDDSISGIVIPTYTAGTGLTLNGTTFNVDTTTIATKEDIANLRTFIVVNTLPSVDTANEKAIYMLGPIGTGSDKYEEYIVTRGDYNWTSATTMYPFSVTRNTWDGSILHDSQTSPLSDFNGECYVGAKITAISDETKLPVKLSFRDPDSTDSEWVGLNEPAFVYEQYAYPDGNDLDIYIPGTSSSNRVTVSAEGVMSSSPITREQGPKQRTKIGETSIDLSGYATTSALTTGLAAKQDTLTASTGINIDSSNNISNTLPGPTIASTAPTGTEGALWYDTTNDVLMAHDGTAWKEAGTQMKVLSYGHSTWQDFLNAYNENAIVYCRASSNSNPGSGNQGRMAFMAYININNSTGLPTEVEFQYYRSRSDHNSAANQLDQVFVYKLTSAGAWTVTERNTGAKAVAGTGINLGRGSGNMTISADTSVLATQTDLSSINGIVSGQIVPPVSSEWEGRIFYCTTDNTFYKCDGTDWAEIGSGGTPTGVITNNTTGTTTSISQIRCGTEAEYQALGTYQEGIAYMTF